MATRKEERDALRQRRLDKEAEQSSSNRKRLTLAYGIGAVAVLIVAVVVVVLASGGDSGAKSGSAHINLNASYGSTNAIQPDERAGTPPPAPKQTNLQVAAKQAGCKLELHLEDE